LAAVAAATGLLLAAAAAWAAKDWLGGEPSTATPVASPSALSCAVTYQFLRDDGRSFAASIIATNLGPAPLADARLTFDLSGDQHVARTKPTVWRQDDRRVSTVPGLLNLGVRRGARLPLSGTYSLSNPFPLQFSLSGKPCAVTIIGPAGKPVVTPSGAVLPTGTGVVVTDIKASPTSGTVQPSAESSPAPPPPASSPSPAGASPPAASPSSSPQPVSSPTADPQLQIEPSPSS
jgi:hypothetical protein